MPPADLAPQGSAAPAETPGPLLASGASADVFAIDEEHVLRRYRGGHDAGPEVELLQHVVAQGFPAPAARHLGGPDAVLERLHGPTLLQALGAGEISLHDAARVLDDLHRALHRIDAPASWRTPPDPDWPHLGGSAVVHLDLHPGNVILTETKGPALVDWAKARAGAPELDVSSTALLIGEVAVDSDGEYSQAARALLAAFLAVTETDPLTALDDAAALRAVDPGLMPGERELVTRSARLVRTLVEVASPPDDEPLPDRTTAD